MTSVPPCTRRRTARSGLEVGVAHRRRSGSSRRAPRRCRPRSAPGCRSARRWPRRSRTEPRCRTARAGSLRSCASAKQPSPISLDGVHGRRALDLGAQRGDLGGDVLVVGRSGWVAEGARRRVTAVVGRRRAHDRPPIVAPVDPAELPVQPTRRPLREHVLGGDRGAGVLAAALEGAGADERGLPRSLPRVDERLGRVAVGRSVARPQVAVAGGGGRPRRARRRTGRRATHPRIRPRRARMDGDGTRCSPTWRFTTLPSRSATWPRPTASTRR